MTAHTSLPSLGKPGTPNPRISRPNPRFGLASPPMKTPALDAWRHELATGVRSATTFDALWEAAAAEMQAVEALQNGLPALADRRGADARRIIEAAAHAREPR